MNEHEAQLIAAALHQARPDWPIKQLLTLMASPGMVDRPRRDVFVALAWVASERGTFNPYRVLEAGPWWKAAAVEGNTSHRDNPPKHLRCSVCSLSKDRCQQVWAADHDFEAIEDRKLPPEQINAVVTELKGHLAPMKTPDVPRSARTHEPTSRAAACRDALNHNAVDSGDDNEAADSGEEMSE